MKWSEQRGKESKCSQWSNPESWAQYIYQYKIQYIIPNTFSNKESIAQEDSLHNQLKNFISYPLIVWGGGGGGGGRGFINHFPSLIGFSMINHPFWDTPIFGNIHISTNYIEIWYYITVWVVPVVLFNFLNPGPTCRMMSTMSSAQVMSQRRPAPSSTWREKRFDDNVVVEVIDTRWWFQTCFLFHPHLGRWSNLTHIFQPGWNHQPAMSLLRWLIKRGCPPGN